MAGIVGVFTYLKRGASEVVKVAGQQQVSQTLGYKHGDQAERLTDDSLAAAGNTATVVAVSTL